MTALLDHLESARRAARKLLVPYVMGGIPDRVSFGPALEAVAKHADAVEVGLPFSDPLMDGPVIAAAADRVLKSGLGPADVMELAGSSNARALRVLMTYYNPIHRIGEDEFCRRAAAGSFSGLIVPDIPFEEAGSLRAAAERQGLAWIPLVAPTSPRERVQRIVATATGFVYAVSTLGVTGAREHLSERVGRVVDRCRDATDLPVVVGIGISNAAQAAEAARIADGVVVGSAVVKKLLEEGVDAAESFLAEIRAALDRVRSDAPP